MGLLSRLTYFTKYRGVNIIMSLLSITFLAAFAFMITKAPSWAPERSQLALIIPSIILTIGLVWYHLSSNPDLKFLAQWYPMPVRTEGSDEERTIHQDYLVKHERGIATETSTFPWPDKDGHWLGKTYKMRYDEFPDKIHVYFYIGNMGRAGVTLHEYRIEGENGLEEIGALHDDITVRIAPPLIELAENLYEHGLKSLNSFSMNIFSVPDSPDGESIWKFMGLEDRPKQYILQTTDERVFLKAKARRPAFFSTPLKRGGERPDIVEGEIYSYTLTLYTTSKIPSDRVTFSFKIEDGWVKWWTTRSIIERWLRRTCSFLPFGPTY